MKLALLLLLLHAVATRGWGPLLSPKSIPDYSNSALKTLYGPGVCGITYDCDWVNKPFFCSYETCEGEPGSGWRECGPDSSECQCKDICSDGVLCNYRKDSATIEIDGVMRTFDCLAILPSWQTQIIFQAGFYISEPQPFCSWSGGCPNNGNCVRRTSPLLVSVPNSSGAGWTSVEVSPSEVCCNRGYGGLYCNEWKGCAVSPCLNGGACRTDGTCSCYPGFKGTYCEIPIINCAVTDWSSWSTCSAPCGPGTQTRSKIIWQQPQNGGTACPPDSSLTETRSCTLASCASCQFVSSYTQCYTASADAVVNPTGCAWSAQDQKCSSGSCSYRKQIGGVCPALVCHSSPEGSCVNGPACGGFSAATCTSAQYSPWCALDSASSLCVQGDCQVSPWQNGPCSNAVCGGGTLTRTREVTRFNKPEGAGCPILLETAVPCNTAPCSRCTDTDAVASIVEPFGRCLCDAPGWAVDTSTTPSTCGCAQANRYGLACNETCNSCEGGRCVLGPFGSGCVCNAASFQIKRLEDGNNRCFFPPPPPIPNPPGYGLGGMVQGEAFRLTECVNYAAVAFNVEWVNVAPFYYITLHHRPIMVSSTTDHYRGRYGDVAGIGGTVPLPHQNCIETPGCSPCTDQVRNLRDRLDVDWRCDYTALPPVVVGYDYYQNNVYAPFSINDASAGDGIGYWEQTASGGLMMRLMPGVYCSNSRGYIEVPSGGTLVLDANFDPKAVFVFRAELIITLFEGSVVTFINNASAVNVLWISKGAVTVGPVEYRGPSTAGLPLPQSDVRTLASGIFISTSTTRHAMALRQTKLEGQFLSVAWYNDIWVQGNSEIHVPGAEYFTPPPSVIPSSSSSTGPFESSSSSSTAPAQSSSSSSSTGPSERSSSSSTARAQSSSSSSSSTGPASSSSSTGASVRSSSSSTGREKSSSSSSSTGRSSSSSSSSTGASSSSTSVGESSSSSGDAVSAIVEDVSFLDSDAGLAIIAGTGAVAIAGIGIAAYCIKAGAQAVQVATSAL